MPYHAVPPFLLSSLGLQGHGWLDPLAQQSQGTQKQQAFPPPSPVSLALADTKNMSQVCHLQNPTPGGFSFLLLFFRAAPAAYGGSQARGRIRATAASLHHSHVGSEPRLRPTPELMAMLDPLPTDRSQGSNPCPHRYQSDLFLLSHDRNSPRVDFHGAFYMLVEVNVLEDQIPPLIILGMRVCGHLPRAGCYPSIPCPLPAPS